MADQEAVSQSGTRGARLPFQRALKALGRQLAKRRFVAVAGIVLLATVVATAEFAPGTSSGFNATVGNNTNSAGTNTNFSAAGGALPYNDTFAGGDAGWIDYGGSWATSTAAAGTSGAVYAETAGSTSGNGPKAVTGQTSWTDYTVQADIKITAGSQAGLLFRVNSPAVGNDALNGYYLGIYTSGSITLGRENNSYTSLKSVAYTSLLNTWYHMSVQVVGCTFVGTVQMVGGLTPATATTISYTDPGCPTSGAIGLRDFSSQAQFRNVTATAGGTQTTTVAPYLDAFATTLTPTTGYTTYGGTWSANSGNETYSNTSGGAGEKSVAGTSTWGNYTLTGDVMLNSSATSTTSAGFLVRVSGAATGANAFNGYYVGVSSVGISLSKMNGTTATVLDSDAYSPPAGSSTSPTLGTGTWMHLTVEAVGCVITATAQLKTGSTLTVSNANDTGCTTTTGLIGARVNGTTATFRDIAVTPR